MKRKGMSGKYFFGNEISEYGQENNRVDYRTLAKSFDAVLNNDIISKTQEIGYWEPINGSEEYYEDSDGNIYNYSKAQERRDALQEERDSIEDDDSEEAEERRAELDDEIERMEDARYIDIFQYYIISDAGAQILQEYTDDIVYRNDELDLNVWCVTHLGTSWDYVLTDIPCNMGEEAYND